ncbi:MAG: SPOR domain-containing protein [Desulfuromonadaceae bacterium]|nr:SPOR domain-containing protein [Desulfuromonadaceae bacterium]
MRIDYSEPKKSCSSPHQAGQNRPRRESSGGTLAVAGIFITGLLCLGIGFGSGWMLSQRSTKKAFQAAMEQQSFENSPQQEKAQPAQQQPAPPPLTQQPQPGGGTAVDPQLSFYKTLPSGQKNNVMGSGFNSLDEKPGKQPLHAAMPANITRQNPPQRDETPQKQPMQGAAAKPATHLDSSGFTVQVASYSLKLEAETLRSKLAAKGFNAAIVESHLGDKGTWYRVRVGKRLDQDAAKELAEKLGKGAIATPDSD